MKCYLFDIDGTIADLSHRLHHIEGATKDWPAFFDACAGDAPIQHIIDLAKQLCGCSIVLLVSGRSDRCRGATVDWLYDHGLNNFTTLYMRKEGDHRPDNIVKLELLAELRADGFDPIMAFDDRDQVVEMWRANGVPCAQVAPGNF